MAYHDGGSVTKAVYGRTHERLGHTTATGPLYEMPDLWGSPLSTFMGYCKQADKS